MCESRDPPAALGLADTLFGTLDQRTLRRTLAKYTLSSLAKLRQGKI